MNGFIASIGFISAICHAESHAIRVVSCNKSSRRQILLQWLTAGIYACWTVTVELQFHITSAFEFLKMTHPSYYLYPIRAVAIMVRILPFYFEPRTKEAFWLLQCVGIHTTSQDLTTLRRTVLYARASRVVNQEYHHIVSTFYHTFCFSPKRYRQFSRARRVHQIVDAITSALTVRAISVTSSGRSSISSIMRYASGWFAAMAFADILHEGWFYLSSAVQRSAHADLYQLARTKSTTCRKICRITISHLKVNFSSGNNGCKMFKWNTVKFEPQQATFHWFYLCSWEGNTFSIEVVSHGIEARHRFSNHNV